MIGVKRWRCLLCRPLRWRHSGYGDWLMHYQLLHMNGDN